LNGFVKNKEQWIIFTLEAGGVGKTLSKMTLQESSVFLGGAPRKRHSLTPLSQAWKVPFFWK
jgi:hypothetical protein